MPESSARVRILEDDLMVVRYNELYHRVVENGETAQSVAIELGLSPAAIIFHLQKMGLSYNRRTTKWEEGS